MNHMLAVMLLAAFALVEAEVFLATYVQQVFRLSCFYFGPTELRVVWRRERCTCCTALDSFGRQRALSAV